MPSASTLYSSAAESLGSNHPSQIKEEIGTKFKVSKEVEYELSPAAGALVSAKPREKVLSYIHDVLF